MSSPSSATHVSQCGGNERFEIQCELWLFQPQGPKSGTSTTVFSSLRAIGTVMSWNAKKSWARILIWSQPETLCSEKLHFIQVGAARLVSGIPVAGRIGENVRGRETHPPQSVVTWSRLASCQKWLVKALLTRPRNLEVSNEKNHTFAIKLGWCGLVTGREGHTMPCTLGQPGECGDD